MRQNTEKNLIQIILRKTKNKRKQKLSQKTNENSAKTEQRKKQKINKKTKIEDNFTDMCTNLYKLSEQPCQVFMYFCGWLCSIFGGKEFGTEAGNIYRMELRSNLRERRNHE